MSTTQIYNYQLLDHTIAAAKLVGTDIDTLGTITTGTWHGTPIANLYLANSTISGIPLGSNLGILTFGTHLAAGAASYNGSLGVTISTDAISANVVSTLVARDTNGDFSARIVTAALSGNAMTATKLETSRTIVITGDLAYTSGAFDGGGNVTGVGTLATVNSNVGSFGSSTAIPTFTVNAKGLITAASTAAVVAPAGTLSGSTLASGVTASSLTSVGTITSGTWQGAVIGSSYLTYIDTLASVTGRGSTTSTALTLNGGFNTTTGSFSGAITSTLTSGNVFNVGSGLTGSIYGLFTNTGGNLMYGIASSTGTFWGTGTPGNYSGNIGTTTNTNFGIATHSILALLIDTSQNATFTGSITAAGGGYNSLRSMKNIHGEFSLPALDIVSQFKFHDFNYRDRPKYDRTVGMIIDEIEKIEGSEWLLSGKDKDSVNIYSMISLGLKSIQELNTKHDTLEEKVKILEERNQQLENQIKRLNQQ